MDTEHDLFCMDNALTPIREKQDMKIAAYMFDSWFFFQPVHWTPTEISVCPSVDTVWETARVTRKTARVRRDAGTAT